MDIQTIPLISVSYNSAELVDELLRSFRQYYVNPVTIIDGSSAEHAPAIEAVCARYTAVKFIHFDYNIHHGPGMAWAFMNLDLHGPVLVLDSDVIVLNPGLLEAMEEQLKPGMYGVGLSIWLMKKALVVLTRPMTLVKCDTSILPVCCATLKWCAGGPCLPSTVHPISNPCWLFTAQASMPSSPAFPGSRTTSHAPSSPSTICDTTGKAR